MLHPLNLLRELHPDVYARELVKYAGREQVRSREVPPLRLGWNDVLHCSPIHPHFIYRSLSALGIRREEQYFFAIPVECLRGLPVAVLLRGDEDCYEGFQEERYHEMSCLPERVLRYYAAEIRAGRSPLLYAFVPHILVAGSISIVGALEVPWSRPPDS